MMKTYKIYFLAIILVFTSCQDFLDLKPKNQIVMNTLEDVQSMMSAYLNGLGVYQYNPPSFNGRTMTRPFTKSLTLGFTMYSNEMDMVRFPTTTWGSSYNTVYYENQDWQGKSLGATAWTNFYAHIGYLNEAVVALDELKGEDQAVWERVMGEAKAIRAYYILKLLEYFCTYDDNEMGIPLNLDPDEITGGKRRKQSEIYGQIIGDLTEVLNYQTYTSDWNMFYKKEIINLILAETYWFKALSRARESSDWENAEKYAAAVLALGNGLETNAEDLKQEFTGNFSSPLVTDNPYAFLKLSSIISGSVAFPEAPFGDDATRGQWPTDEFYNQFDEDDIRVDAFFGHAVLNGVNVPYIRKYKLTSFTNETAVLFRIAHAHLICAEANARLGRDKAATLLQEFQAARKSKNSGADVLDEILKERKKEFCYEFDYNWLDMKRLHQKVTRQAMDSKTNEATEFTLESNDYRYALCIPLDEELTLNPDLTNNPGWNL